MIDRICISINNRCNLACSYCHFHEKGAIEAAKMDVYEILDHVKEYARPGFKIGFVGNGECFLDWQALKSYIAYLENAPDIRVYTITNGTIKLPAEDLAFLEKHRVNVGFSIDGYKELHDRYRCNSFDRAMENVEHYRQVTGHYPTFNATVGRESLENAERVISFFKPFGTRVTFSRMIGRYGISLGEYRDFLDRAERELAVRRGGRAGGAMGMGNAESNGSEADVGRRSGDSFQTIDWTRTRVQRGQESGGDMAADCPGSPKPPGSFGSGIRTDCAMGTERSRPLWPSGRFVPGIRTDCTMYGGLCGAGTNNYFFANGKVYYCGNCIDLPPVGDSGMSFEELEKISLTFDRHFCYKESL